MQLPESYEKDLLIFFERHTEQIPLYQSFFTAMEAVFPQARVKVQKSQISFYNKHLFAMVSFPGKKSLPGLLISFGLARKLASPRVSIAVEAYPNRWTHHVPLTSKEQLDSELIGWLQEAYTFSVKKR